MNDHEQNGILKIHRIPNFVGSIRTYSIIIDGEKVNSIKNGETIEMTLPAGHHRAMVKLDWMKSNEIDIVIKQNEIKRLHISREQIKRGKLIAIKAFYVLLILIGAVTGFGGLVGAGAAMLVIHRTGKMRIF